MRAPFQEGEFPFPVKYGYCSVGVVEAGEAGLLGREVFCLYPHQTAYVVPAPGGDAAAAGACRRRGPCSRPTWRRRSTPCGTRRRIGERIHVVGAGVVGCLVAWLCGRIPGVPR